MVIQCHVASCLMHKISLFIDIQIAGHLLKNDIFGFERITSPRSVFLLTIVHL